MSILNSIMNGAWAIDPKYAYAYLPFISSLLEGKDPSSFLPQKQEVTISYIERTSVLSATSGRSKSSSVGRRIAVFTIKGVLTKDDGFCSAGMESMDMTLKRVLNDSEIGGVLLNMDTPGGEASYTPLFGQTIRNASKPIITYANRLLASAGYWLGSSSREIYASYENDTIGSIGTMVSIMDFRKKMEKDGVNVIDIYATKSDEKNYLHKAFLEGDYKSIQKEMLDPINEAFINDVKSSREISDERAFKGRTFRAKEAVINGMIDGIKSFEECITRLEELISSENNSQATPKTNNIMSKRIQTVASFLGYESLESKNGQISLSEEDFAKIGAELEKPKATEPPREEEESLSERISEQISAMSNKVDGIQASLSGIEGRVGSLEKVTPSAGATTTTVPKETETDDEAETKLSPWDDPNDPLNKQIDRDLK